MKRLALLPILLLGLASASSADEPPASPTPEPQVEPASSPAVQGEVVSVDADAKLIRLKGARSDGADLGEVALSVDADAASGLDLKAGDKVTATCKEGTSGAACVVTGVQKDPS